MKLFTSKIDSSADFRIVADDMILTKDMPTAAGSKMLDGYVSLFEAEALTKLKNAGYGVVGKADVGEFGFDLLGETSYNGAIIEGGVLKNAAAEIVKSGEADGAVCLDVNGSPRRAAAQSGLVSVKPTYGTVSRFGTIPVACSGETVSFMASSVKAVRDMLFAASGHDDKDGTSLSDELCEKAKRCDKSTPVRKIAVINELCEGISADVKAGFEKVISALEKNGCAVEYISNSTVAASRVAWNILMSAELCNNVSRYDGVKYGYRAENFSGLDELYTNSRTEAFGGLLKTAIIFGSETLSTENYMKVYDKALRVRRLVVEAFGKIFESYDAVLMPAVSDFTYTEESVKNNKYLCYEENKYTAPASISGLPTVVASGVQLVGAAFSEGALLALAEAIEGEGV